MQLLHLWTVMAAVIPRDGVASVDMSCDCRMWHLRDPSINLHCSSRKDGTSGVSCEKAQVADIPRGYHYVSGYGLLKLHRTYMTWWEAKKACEADGARLAVPPDRQAVDGMNRIFSRERGLWWAFVGISDEANEGVYVGVDGRPAPYLPWQPKQPSDQEAKENCVNTRNDGLFNDLRCDFVSPFFCERVLSVTVSDSYHWLEDAGRFYKVHSRKLAHAQAIAACRSENATLAVIDTWQRAEALLRSLLEPLDVRYRIGLTDLKVEGDFVTETGRHLNDMEYQVWGLREPNNTDASGKEENCLALSGEGYLSDVSCEGLRPYICEIVPT